MRVLVLLGPPGAGKGTQAGVVAEGLGILHLASGDLFRAETRAGTPLGREVKAYVDRGALVPDALTVRMIMDRLGRADARDGVVLDGFPRTVDQARALDDALGRRGERVEHAIYLDVPNEVLVRRLSSRLVCPDGHVYNTLTDPPAAPGVCDSDGHELVRRADDEPETVRQRLAQQLGPLYEVVDHYRDGGVLSVVDATQTIAQVSDEVLRLVRVGDRAA